MTTPAEQSADVIRDVLAIYEDGERLLLRKLSRRLALSEIDDPTWVDRKLSEVRIHRIETQRDLARMEGLATEEIDKALAKAYERGLSLSSTDMAAAGTTTENLLGQRNRDKVRLQVEATVKQVTATHRLAVAQVNNTYRAIVAGATIQQTTGVLTRREAAARALSAFAQQGITGYTSVDKNGRRRTWDLPTYVEATTRKAARTAAINGQTDRLVENGHDLVVVSDSPEECDLCAEWEGEILSLTGRTPGYATLDEAEAGGLFHPGCTHSVSGYFEGLTKVAGKADKNPQGYKDRQDQRRYEREIRASKRMEAAAGSPAEAARAKKRISDYQAKVRNLVATTDQQRSPERERLGTAR